MNPTCRLRNCSQIKKLPSDAIFPHLWTVICQLTHDGELAGLALRVVDGGLRGVVDQARWLLRRVNHRVGPEIWNIQLLCYFTAYCFTG